MLIGLEIRKIISKKVFNLCDRYYQYKSIPGIWDLLLMIQRLLSLKGILYITLIINSNKSCIHNIKININNIKDNINNIKKNINNINRGINSKIKKINQTILISTMHFPNQTISNYIYKV
jgi:hypothetical protein